MAHATKKGHGNPWRNKETDEKYHHVETKDGTKYTLHLPNFNQTTANRNSSEKYKDVFDKIKTKVKDDPTIEKNDGGLPILDHDAWAEILSSTLKELNITWGVNDKIWIYNKMYDGKNFKAMYVAITPNITQRNAKRKARKGSEATAAADDEGEHGAAYDDHGAAHDGYIRDEDIEFGTEPLPPITQEFHIRTRFNGDKYYYLNEKDANEGNSNYDHVEEYVSDDEESIASADEDEDDRKAGGTRLREKASNGGKSTRKRLRRKSTSKQLKKKRVATQRKMRTTRRK
jgi:hypothetical protein